MSGWRERALAAIFALGMMVALPVACFALRGFGPAARVVYFAYLPLEELALCLSSALLGAALGVDARRWLGRSTPHAGRRRPPRVRLTALALLMVWVLLPQLRAFPAHASVAERDAWARDRVREYPALKRVVAALPAVQRDVGHIIAIAPTADDQHRFATEMNGDDMIFALEVIGAKGAGTFRANCTLDAYRVYDWRAGSWTFGGHEQRIDEVPERVP